ncbi:hypothetical protein [Micromonospora sp. C95]|uniref:hypothetical protein n=1 Tax=Micromonospora sp. C95 TaxID=2824882 RepID=UPI001B370452|nr:hypothetical protein [Micromonospora sp. C95]MBQ1027658.1 hypothetical protein [Micromonospora sp. C95]
MLLDGRASVQFGGDRALWLRVSSICDRPTYDGWIWLAGYAINPTTGEALARREVFARIAGLQIAPQHTDPPGTARQTTRRRGV